MTNHKHCHNIENYSRQIHFAVTSSSSSAVQSKSWIKFHFTILLLLDILPSFVLWQCFKYDDVECCQDKDWSKLGCYQGVKTVEDCVVPDKCWIFPVGRDVVLNLRNKFVVSAEVLQKFSQSLRVRILSRMTCPPSLT